MNTPTPKISPDAALGNLMAAALDVPTPADPPEVPSWAPDNTPSIAPVAVAQDGMTPPDVLLSVWNAMQNAADGNDLLSRLEHMRGSIARAVSARAELPMSVPGNRAYLAGPMTGIAEFNFPAFHAAAERLRGFGLDIVNPADHGVVDGATWSDYMRWDLMKLVGCHAVCVLPGWENSKGASLEVAVAHALGMPVCTVEGVPVPPPPSGAQTAAARDVLAERQRQVQAEGWSNAHDDEHDAGDMAAAGASYALNAADLLHPFSQGDGGGDMPDCWPWATVWWKPSTARRDLVKAAALILAEIERCDRAEAETQAISGGAAC